MLDSLSRAYESMNHSPPPVLHTLFNDMKTVDSMRADKSIVEELYYYS